MSRCGQELENTGKWEFSKTLDKVFLVYRDIYWQLKILRASQLPHCWWFWRHIWAEPLASQRFRVTSCLWQCTMSESTLNRGIAAVPRSVSASPLTRILLALDNFVAIRLFLDVDYKGRGKRYYYLRLQDTENLTHHHPNMTAASLP